MGKLRHKIFLLFVISSAFAQNANQYEPIIAEDCSDCCGFNLPLPCHPPVCAYNAPDVIDTFCGYDVIVSATYLLWEAKQEGLELGHICREYKIVIQL